MSEEEWQRVVDAMWVLRTVKTADGKAKYGREYRDMDFHILRHVLGTLPGLDRVRSGELKDAPIDVTGGNAHTYTWHALFGLEVETSLMIVDRAITGLPYLDWGAMTSPSVAAIYRRRLGVGVAELSDAESVDIGEMGSRDVLKAWAAPANAGTCLASARHRCEPRWLADGSFARWPIPRFDWDEWYAAQSAPIQRLFARVHARADSIVKPLIHRGQLRCNASGSSIYRHASDRHADDATAAHTPRAGASRARPPLPFVVRGAGTFEHVFVNRSSEWRAAVDTCLGAMRRALHQDMTECIEGRMALNRFSIHFQAHFLGGDMGWAVIPHDPLFFFHHNGLDRLRRQWQASHADRKPMAFGYPVEARAYTSAYGTPVGLHDCLGCTAYNAGFTKEVLLGSWDDDINALPLPSAGGGWLTNADLLCVIDDVYTFDVIEEAEGRDPAALKLLYRSHSLNRAGATDADEHCPAVVAPLAAVAICSALALAVALLARNGWLAVLSNGPAELGSHAAPLLVLGSALAAGLMSLAAGRLATAGVPTPTISAACGLVAGALFVTVRMAEPRPPPWPDTSALLTQAVLGGLLPHLAFYAISASGLAVANCLMFTMPLWTAAFASLLGGAPWGAADATLSGISMLGVWLVARPNPSTAFSTRGVVAGLGFGASGGLLNVALSSERLRAASPCLVSAWQLGATVLFAAPSLSTLAGSPLGAAACSPTLLVGTALVGVLMFVMSWMRTIGLQKATSSTVATLLYTEIVWAFLFDVLFLAAHPDSLQVLGAVLIIGGAIAYALHVQHTLKPPPPLPPPPARTHHTRFPDLADLVPAEDDT